MYGMDERKLDVVVTRGDESLKWFEWRIKKKRECIGGGERRRVNRIPIHKYIEIVN